MESNKSIIRYVLIYLVLYLSFSFFSTNFTPFLSEIGFNPMERGVILSGGALVALVIQLAIGYLSDKYQTAKKIIIVMLVLYCIVAFFSFEDKMADFMIQFILISAAGGLVVSITGIFDAWLLGINDKMRDSMSFVKAFGSVGWAIGAVASSYLLRIFEWKTISYFIIFLILIVFAFMKNTKDVEKVESADPVRIQNVIQLFKNKKYVLLILILLLDYSLIIANSGIVIDKMISLEATNLQISTKWSVGSLMEIPTFVIGYYLIKNIRGIRLLQLSIAASCIQFVLFSITNSIEHIIWLTALQAFSTPIIMIASKVLIFSITPRRLMNTSQMIALGLFTGIPSIAVPAVAGTFALRYGINMTLMMISCLGGVSFLLTFLYIYWERNGFEIKP